MSILLYECTTWMLTKRIDKKASRQLHKNVVSCIEQVLEATPYKTPAVRPPTTNHETIQVRRTRHARQCRRSKDELISDVHLWTHLHGQAKVGRATRTYIQQLYTDTGCSLEDFQEAMDDWDEWRKRVREIRASSVTWYIYIYILKWLSLSTYI